jgi:hypothetical protein
MMPDHRYQADDFDRHNQAVPDPEKLWQAYRGLLTTLSQHQPGRTSGWCGRCTITWPCPPAVRAWQRTTTEPAR